MSKSSIMESLRVLLTIVGLNLVSLSIFTSALLIYQVLARVDLRLDQQRQNGNNECCT